LHPEKVQRGKTHWTRRLPEKMVRLARGERNGHYTKPECTLRGEDHPRAKVTDGKVIRIRKLWATGKYTIRQLGRMFGLGEFATADIVYNRSWRHLL
jgi:hypothetical protein